MSKYQPSAPATRAAEQNAERVQSPVWQLSPLAADHASRAECEVDTAISERANRGHYEKARAAVVGREIGAISERKAKPDNKPAHRSSRIAIGGSQPPEERRRPIGAADDRLAEGKEERAEKRADDQRAAVKQERRAGRAQDQGRDRIRPMNSAP